MARRLNDLGNRCTPHVAVRLLTEYQYGRAAGLSSKRAMAYAIIAVERKQWHSSGGQASVAGPAMRAAIRGEHRIVATPERFKQLLVSACGAMPRLPPKPATFYAEPTNAEWAADYGWYSGKLGRYIGGLRGKARKRAIMELATKRQRRAKWLSQLNRTAERAIVAAIHKGKPELVSDFQRAKRNCLNVCGKGVRNTVRKWRLLGWGSHRGSDWRAWTTTDCARKLFVCGWGKFDVAAVVRYSLMYKASFVPCTITSEGYGFANVETYLLARSKPWQAWFTRHWQWWRAENRLARIDELCHNGYATAEAYLRVHPDCTPQGLLTHIAGLRERDDRRWLERESGQPLELPYRWLTNVPAKQIGEYTLAPVRSGDELVTVSNTLENCAANYHREIAERDCMLVACIDQTGQPIGLGELLPNGRWGQISGKGNKALPAAIKALFHDYTPQAMAAVWVGEPQPAIAGDTIDWVARIAGPTE